MQAHVAAYAYIMKTYRMILLNPNMNVPKSVYNFLPMEPLKHWRLGKLKIFTFEAFVQKVIFKKYKNTKFIVMVLFAQPS